MEDNKTTEYVTLVSNDGYEFKLLRSAACIAGTIKKALDPMCNVPCQLSFNPNTLLTRLHSRIQRKYTKSRRSAHHQVRRVPTIPRTTKYDERVSS